MDRKTEAKRKQFLSIYLPSIIVQTPTLAKARIEDKKFIEDFDDIIKSAVKECVKEADSVQNPYPKSVFPMNTDEYVKAIPDEHLRTAISGYCGRIFFDIAKKEIVKAIRDSKE